MIGHGIKKNGLFRVFPYSEYYEFNINFITRSIANNPLHSETKQVTAAMFLTLSIIATSLIAQSNAQGLSYNYFDEMAQTYCASRYKYPSFIFAIRRDCRGVGPTCNEICKQATAEAVKTIGGQRKK